VSVRADLSVRATDFVLGDVLTDGSDTRIRLERVVPLGDAVIPYLRVSGSDLDDVVAALRDDPDVTDVTVLDELDGEALVRLEWASGASDLLEGLAESDATLVGAVGDGDSWSLRLRFPDRERLSEFYHLCVEHGIGLTVESVFRTDGEGWGHLQLTDAQQETLRIGLERGYFDVPREITLVELADEFGISDTAASQRLRRGVSKIVETCMAEPGERSPAARSP
jgi:predicted DNA binding protein